MKKKLFIAAIAIALTALTAPAFAATNGGVSTWLQVGNDFASARNYYGVETWDMSLQDMSATDMVAFGPGASAQTARDVGFANISDVVTIVDTTAQGVASAPSRRSYADLWAGSETDISVPNTNIQLTEMQRLTATNGGVASGQGGSSIVIFNN